MKLIHYTYHATAIIAFAFALNLPGSASADLLFEPPIGCTPVLTVQHRSCQVTNHWRCGAGDALENWYGTFVDNGTVDTFEKYGPDHDLIYIQDFEDGGLIAAVHTAKDNSSLSALAAGKDSIDVILRMNLFVLNIDMHLIAESRLTGNTLTVDQEKLAEVSSSVAITALDTELLGDDANVHGNAIDYYLADPGVMIEGSSRLNMANEVEANDHTPVEIIRSGEDGFFTKIPKYDCGAKTSQLKMNSGSKPSVLTRLSNILPEGSTL